MFVLHIEIKAKPGLQQALEEAYVKSFRPAISTQEGFRATALLHSNENDASYRLSLAFDSHASQKKWVETETHQRVWPLIESQCIEFSVKGYHAV